MGGVFDPADINDGEVGGEELERQRWIHDAVGECLADVRNSAVFHSRDRMGESLTSCVNIVTRGYVGKFERLINVALNKVAHWKCGKSNPQLQKALEICALARVRLFDFYTGNVKDNVQLPEKKASKPRAVGRRRPDWKEVERILISALRETPPPPFVVVARRMDIPSVTVRWRFPGLCSKLVARHARHQETLRAELLSSIKAIVDRDEYPPPCCQEVARRVKKNGDSLMKLAPEYYKIILDRYSAYKRSRSEEARRSLRAEIRQIATALHQEGKRPSFPAVAACLKSPNLMVREHARNELREVQRELGYL